MAVTANQVQELYLAYFGRPAEQAGLTYWTADANATVEGISASFVQQPEYTSVYGGLTRSQTINQLYQNLFNRPAGAEDLAYWQNSTDVSVDRLALALVNGALGNDRLLLDGKTQYATAVTANAGASATATDVNTQYKGANVLVDGAAVSLDEYLAVGGNTAARFYQLAATQTANLSDIVVSGATLQDGNGTALTNGADFGELTAGTITLENASGTAAVALAAGNAVTDLTLTGTSGVATGDATATTLTLTETDTTKIVTDLHLNISDAAVANESTTVNVAGLTALTNIDAAASTADLNIDASALASLATLTAGSGNDELTVTTAGSDAVALTVNAGAGNDTVNVAFGNAALTIDAGAGNDTVVLGVGVDGTTAVAATGAATTSHVTTITLGAGNDTLEAAGANNIVGYTAIGTSTTASVVNAANTALTNSLVSITDFNASQDVLSLSGLTVASLTNTQTGAISNASSLAAAVELAASNLGSANAAAFQYGNNTYVFVNHGEAGVQAGDGLVELTGFTGQLTDANFAHA